ncbi:MAG: hypothetical protein V9G12_07060 [Microthrixaceae bacterium]
MSDDQSPTRDLSQRLPRREPRSQCDDSRHVRLASDAHRRPPAHRVAEQGDGDVVGRGDPRERPLGVGDG